MHIFTDLFISPPSIMIFWSFYFFVCADVMVLNDIIEQAAGRHSRASAVDGGEYSLFYMYHSRRQTFNIHLTLRDTQKMLIHVLLPSPYSQNFVHSVIHFTTLLQDLTFTHFNGKIKLMT